MASGKIKCPNFSLQAGKVNMQSANSFSQVSSGGGMMFWVVSYSGSDPDAPVTANANWWNVIVLGTTNRMTQIATIIYPDYRNKMFFRVRHDNTWYGWYALTGQ